MVEQIVLARVQGKAWRDSPSMGTWPLRADGTNREVLTQPRQPTLHALAIASGARSVQRDPANLRPKHPADEAPC